jgi:CRP-like cAMP-binding protein
MILEPVETVKILQKNGQPKVFAAGATIFAEGEKAVAMYGIVSGEVNISVGGTVVEKLKAGDVFGIGALVHPDLTRTSTATAKTDCQIVSIDREHFLFAVQEFPMFALEALKSYSDRLRHFRS